MDSVTQFSLGAAVGLAVLGRRLGARRAALTGGVLGTLPDLDVLWPYDGPVASYIWHRAVTHSLIVQALATPLVAEMLRRLFRTLHGARFQTYAAVFLCLSTHALLDALTIYGTRLFWPLWPEAVGLGSVFIIDPLYTLPLLAVLVAALCQAHWTPRLGRGLVVAFAVSTAYLGWGVAAQQWAEVKGQRLLAQHGISAERMVAMPTPFNSLFWKVIAIDGPVYFNLYLPLLGDATAVTIYRHARLPGTGCIPADRTAAQLQTFSDGFWRLRRHGHDLEWADLRMGLTPEYAFQFVLGRYKKETLQGIAPIRRAAVRSMGGDLRWLLEGVLGRKMLRTAEVQALVPLTADRFVATSRAKQLNIC